MFKQAKAQQNLLLKAPRRNITKHKLHLHRDHNDQKRAGMFNVYSMHEHNLGVVKMNREHRYNTLTPHLIDDILRGVDTMNGDSFRHAIYLTTDKHEHWSNGTDFRTIAHMKKEDQYGRIQEYMRQIYYLQTHIAEINKPLIAVASGHAKNSGATFLAACAHPMTTHDARICFNETTFGFVPHAGASFYMSRMKGEFGTFMALTGLQIQGTEATRMDLTRGTVYDAKEYEMDVSDQVSQLPWPLLGGNEQFKPHADEAFHTTPWQNQQENRDYMRKQFLYKEGNRFLTDMGLGNMGRLQEPDERTISGIAEANFNYMKYIRQDALNKEGQNDVGYLEFGEGIDNSRKFMYKNYFDEVLGAITSQIGNPTTQIDGSAVNQQQLIDRCFFSNSVPEIMENLRQEQHPFATRCLEAMQRNSPQSMQLALSMLRKAQNLCYKGCLEMELNVAFNRMQDSDFDLGVKAILGSPKKEGELFHRTPKWAPLLKDDELARYFDENKFANGIDLQVVENALLPTKHYYKKYTDQVRLWLNQTTATQEVIRECFDQEARQALQEQGIDVRDLALTPEIARNHLAAKLGQERVDAVYSERAEQLMTDEKLRQKYFQQIQTHVAKFDKNDDAFYKQVNKNIQDVFQQAYFTRLDTIHRKSQEAHRLEKRRMLIRLKKYYFKQRILQYNEERFQLSQKQASALPFKQMHLTEKWDQCFRDMKHPDLHKSPLYYIAEALGRVSLTAPEMAKSWLTDPENRELMTTITIDKNELDRINTDLLSNPEKYEMIFTMQGYEPGTFEDRDFRQMVKRQRALNQAKTDEHEYWFRLLNEGRCPLDSLPYAQEYNAYRDWADLVQYNATNTLRAVINKLLIDHEKATSFNGNLKNLLAQVNQTQQTKPKKQNKTRPKMGESTRPQSEIKRSITRMLRNDPNLKLIYSDDNLSKNSLVSALKEESEAELLRLVEIVLLDTNQVTLEKHQVEKRLAQMTNPEASIGISLNLIDQYLHLVNGEALVKEAFSIVAPFYSEFIMKRLNQEAEDVMHKLNFDELEPTVMMYYWLNREFPLIKDNPVLNKFINYSFDKEMYDHAEARFPYLARRFQKSDISTILGGEDLNAKRNTPVSELKYDSLEQTRAQMKFHDETMAKLQEEQVFAKSSDEVKEKWWTLTGFEQRELNQIQHSMCDIEDFLYSIKYEIDNHMTDLDMLKWYVESIEKYNLDVNLLQKTIKKDSKANERYYESLSEYARFISHFAQGISTTAAAHEFDGIKFLETYDSKRSQQQSFYQAARQERDFTYKEQQQEVNFDRHAVIKRQIQSFNDLKDSYLSQKEHQEQLMQLVDKLPNKQEVTSFINSSELLDYNKLFRKIAANDFKFLEKPSLVINEANAVKAANKQISSLDSAVDVLSLSQLRKSINDNVLLKPQQRTNLNTIIDYVMEQTKYMSNAERKQITVKDYLHSFNSKSPAAYTQYTSDLLKAKLESVLGSKQFEEGMIDWQIGQIRTMPNDHILPNKAALREQIEKIEILHPKILKLLSEKPTGDFVKDAAIMLGAKYASEQEEDEASDDEAVKQKVQRSKGREQHKVVKKQKVALPTYNGLDLDAERMDVFDSKSDPEDEDEEPTEEEVAQMKYELYVMHLKDNERQQFEKMYASANKKQKALVDAEMEEYATEYMKELIQEQIEENDYPVGPVKAKDPVLGLKEQFQSMRNYVNNLIYREARDICELPQLMVHTKNLYENQVLMTMIESDFQEDVLKKINETIEAYFNIRLNGMMLNKAWANAVNKDYGHLYLKVLREKVVEELGLGETPLGHNLSYENVMNEFRNTQYYDLENKYNLDHLNNENAVGFDNLLARARAASAEELHKSAHESVFDKLLADYFLQKRGEYKDSNKMFNDLVKIFEDKNATTTKKAGIVHLENTMLRQNIELGEHKTATIAQTNFRDLINLDVITSRAMQRCKNGLSDNLRQLSITETDHPDWHTTQVPEYFELFDVRKPAELYVEDKLMTVINECFQVRAELEKRLTRAELSAFDKVLARYLQKGKLMPKLKEAIDADYNALNQGKTLVNSVHDRQKYDAEVQLMKMTHEQRDRNKNIVDDNAIFKELAFETMTELRNTEASKKDFTAEVKGMFVQDSFEEYYRKQLRLDATQPPRPINPDDFKSRKPWDRPVGLPFKTREERIVDLKQDHALYQEKKLEQQDRIRLFYILEQFYEQARNKPDPSSKGQQIISEYFAAPENTFFFDKNKIV